MNIHARGKAISLDQGKLRNKVSEITLFQPYPRQETCGNISGDRFACRKNVASREERPVRKWLFIFNINKGCNLGEGVLELLQNSLTQSINVKERK